MEIISLNTLSKRYQRQPAEIEAALTAKGITATGTYGPITYYGVEAVKALEGGDEPLVTEAAAVDGPTIVGVPGESLEIQS